MYSVFLLSIIKNIVTIITIMIISLIIGKMCKNTIIYLKLGFVMAIMWSLIMILLPLSNHFIVLNTTEITELRTKPNIYNCSDEIKNCLNNQYGEDFLNLSKYNYYYDYIKTKNINNYESVSGFINIIKKDYFEDVAKTYILDCELHQITNKLTLSGVLKATIDNGKNKYSIDGYILADDDNCKIASLANNLKEKCK